jgi:homogentisate 1,2-dioxygenase
MYDADKPSPQPGICAPTFVATATRSRLPRAFQPATYYRLGFAADVTGNPAGIYISRIDGIVSGLNKSIEDGE